eukprot:6082810-Pleurochrysis_carterae.AAC.1
MLRGSLRLPAAGFMQPSKCSVASEVGPASELCRLLHCLPRFWSGGSECGITAGRMQVALGYGVL